MYWEMVLYDRGFPKTPEDRVGFLVWRMHRCCRVIFSLGYHLGQMTPRQCVDLLVDRVGFEPDNAAAEVRRSFAGGYGPLYQAAYLVGAMQFRALRKELVDTGKMTERDVPRRAVAGEPHPGGDDPGGPDRSEADARLQARAGSSAATRPRRPRHHDDFRSPKRKRGSWL